MSESGLLFVPRIVPRVVPSVRQLLDLRSINMIQVSTSTVPLCSVDCTLYSF